MMGLKRGRKQRGGKRPAVREPQPLPVLTPAQRILQRQWLQPAVSEVPPNVRLPQGTEIALVPVAKRPKTATNPGTRREAAVVADGNGGGSRGRAISYRVCTVVPPLLSPMSSNHDEEEADHRGQVMEKSEEKARSKMAVPTATMEGEQANMAASPSSTREAPSGTEDPVPSIALITTTAQVHVPAEPRRERAEPRRERAGGNQPEIEDAITIDATMADRNEGEAAQVFSQEPQRQMLEMLREWKRGNSERHAAALRKVAMIDHEMQSIRERLRELAAERVEAQLVCDRMSAQHASINIIVND
uniref:Uncharacterized protein n=1 Tax=Anoplophora glabripennis TaxID=217634 RepID=V5GGR1_ANOGL